MILRVLQLRVNSRLKNIPSALAPIWYVSRGSRPDLPLQLGKLLCFSYLFFGIVLFLNLSCPVSCDRFILYSPAKPVALHEFEKYSTNFQPHGYFVALFKVFCFSDAYFDGHEITAIFGKERSLKFSIADPHVDRNHSPAIRHQAGYSFDVLGFLRWNRNEEKWCWPPPVNNFATEFNNHSQSISNAQRSAGREKCMPGIISVSYLGFGNLIKSDQ